MIGHYTMLDYVALAENQSKARVKFDMLQRMTQPCGPPPHDALPPEEESEEEASEESGQARAAGKAVAGKKRAARDGAGAQEEGAVPR